MGNMQYTLQVLEAYEDEVARPKSPATKRSFESLWRRTLRRVAGVIRSPGISLSGAAPSVKFSVAHRSRGHSMRQLRGG
jgi:hypothetical protein